MKALAFFQIYARTLGLVIAIGLVSLTLLVPAALIAWVIADETIAAVTVIVYMLMWVTAFASILEYRSDMRRHL